MADEQTGADPEHVIPPPPADAGAGGSTNFPPATPLAGPLSASPPSPPGAPLPPYAAGTPAAAPPTAGAYPPPPPGAAYSAPGTYPSPGAYPVSPHTPPPTARSNTLGIVLAIVGGVVVLAVVGIAVLVGLLLQSPETSPARPVPTAFADDPDEPSDDTPSDDTPSDDSSDADASGIAERLEAKIEEYKRLRDSGALWQTIPDNEYNRTAVTAFLYLMTDMKVATIWGIDEAQAQEYDERMVMLEEKLLAQEPLGDNIKITLEDKVFTYDGATGEGGYTDK